MCIRDVETAFTIISYDLSKIVLVGSGSSLIIWEGSALSNSRIPILIFCFFANYFCLCFSRVF